MGYELVTRCSEFWTHTRISELRTIDHISIMFDTDSHRKWFLCHMKSFCIDHLIGITCRVTNRENEGICFNCFISIYHNSLEYIIFDDHISHTGTKANFRTKRNNLVSEVSHEDSELICSDMSLCGIENLLRCSCFYELFKYILTPRIINHGIEFSIRESPCSTFSKLNIRILIE